MHHAHDLFGCRSSTDDSDDDDDACYSSPIVIIKLVMLHSQSDMIMLKVIAVVLFCWFIMISVHFLK